MLTPVRSSPAMIARSIGAAPRQRGSSEGWTLSIGSSESSGSRISWPKAQTAATSGRAARIRSSGLGVVDALGLEQLDPELARPPRRPAAAASCGPGPWGGRAG